VDIELFDFELDKHKIALVPAAPRDHSKLMFLDQSKRVSHKHFYDLPNLLNPNDIIVINNTRVMPTYFEIKRWRNNNISNIKLNIIRQLDDGDWIILAKPKRRLEIMDKLIFSDKDDVSADVIGLEDQHVKIRFNQNMDMVAWIEDNGKLPLPPYITAQRELRDEDKVSYQTVYAKHSGSAAAPTAGLHFTEKLFDDIKSKGVGICNVLLHVGTGTFAPIKTKNIMDHKIHSEWCCLDADAANALNAARAAGGKIIAVGTTAMRILETAVDDTGNFSEYKGETDIYIKPGYNFKATNALITNFHLPKSSLFVLVCAYYGINDMQRAYASAMDNNYRFYSYGDACFICGDLNV
tara:strand:+ start:252 stop:1307 length:1056 start_codon:yes stop_codon:yes gene_type:complete